MKAYSIVSALILTFLPAVATTSALGGDGFDLAEDTTKLLREWLVAGGTIGAAVVAAVGVIVALVVSAREHKTAVALHTDATKREKERIGNARMALATVLFVEIHNRAARCLLDGVTWATKHIDGHSSRRRVDCPKFRPFPPTVYDAVADRLTELPSDAAHDVVRFYNALHAVDRQVSDATENPEAYTDHRTGMIATELTTARENKLIAARFHQTLLPAIEAVESLRPLVRHSNKIEERLRDADRQYLGSSQVLIALNLEEPPLLRDALRERFKWFQNHEKLGKFVNYLDDAETD